MDLSQGAHHVLVRAVVSETVLCVGALCAIALRSIYLLKCLRFQGQVEVDHVHCVTPRSCCMYAFGRQQTVCRRDTERVRLTIERISTAQLRGEKFLEGKVHEERRTRRIRKCPASRGGHEAVPLVAQQYHGCQSGDQEVQVDRQSGHCV